MNKSDFDHLVRTLEQCPPDAMTGAAAIFLPMEKFIPLIEFTSYLRGCGAALCLPLSSTAKLNIARRMDELLTNYAADDRGAHLKVEQ
jgi:hypothetical protein